VSTALGQAAVGSRSELDRALRIGNADEDGARGLAVLPEHPHARIILELLRGLRLARRLLRQMPDMRGVGGRWGPWLWRDALRHRLDGGDGDRLAAQGIARHRDVAGQGDEQSQAAARGYAAEARHPAARRLRLAIEPQGRRQFVGRHRPCLRSRGRASAIRAAAP